MTAVTIRKAETSDVQAVYQLFLESDRYHCEMLPGEFKPPEEVTAHRNVAGLLAMENYITLVAEREGAVKGFIQGQVHQIDSLMCLSRRVGYITDIVVTSAERKQGIGSQLLAALEALFQERVVTELMLNVYHFNEAASAFYERHGYQGKFQVMSKTIG